MNKKSNVNYVSLTAIEIEKAEKNRKDAIELLKKSEQFLVLTLKDVDENHQEGCFLAIGNTKNLMETLVKEVMRNDNLSMLFKICILKEMMRNEDN